MEGGYDLRALRDSAVAHVRALLEGYPVIKAEIEAETAAQVEAEGHSKEIGQADAAPYRGGDEVAALVDYLQGLGIK